MKSKEARKAREEAEHKAEEAKSRAKKKRDAHFPKAVFEEEGDFEGAIFKGLNPFPLIP